MTELEQATEHFHLAHEAYLNAVFLGLSPGDLALCAESVAKAAHLWDLETRTGPDGVVKNYWPPLPNIQPITTKLHPWP